MSDQDDFVRLLARVGMSRATIALVTEFSRQNIDQILDTPAGIPAVARPDRAHQAFVPSAGGGDHAGNEGAAAPITGRAS